MKIVKYEGAYSPQSYVEMVTGQCYLFRADTLPDLIREIRHDLKISGYALRDYPLSEIAEIVKEEMDVVLVELAGEDGGGERSTVYRWFEVPEQG